MEVRKSRQWREESEPPGSSYGGWNINSRQRTGKKEMLGRWIPKECPKKGRAA